MLLRVRFKVIEILSKLSCGDLLNLKNACIQIEKPAFFDEIFELVKLHAQFNDLGLHSQDFEAARIIHNFCRLEALDIALNCLKNLLVKEKLRRLDHYTAINHVVELLLKCGNFKKVKELVESTIVPGFRSSSKAVIDIGKLCIKFGKIDEGYALAIDQKYVPQDDYLVNLLRFLSPQETPILKMLKGKKFSEALSSLKNIEFGGYENKEDIRVLIQKCFEQDCYKLIQEGKFDEVKNFVVNPGLIHPCHIENVCEALGIGLAKADRFEEAVDCARLIDAESRRMKIYTAMKERNLKKYTDMWNES